MTERILPPHDWDRIPVETELASIRQWLRPGVDEVLVIENEDGEIVGCWALIMSDHAEGIWTHPSYRGGMVIWRLWRFLRERVRARGRRRVFTSAADADVKTLITSARVKGEPFPDSFVIEVD